MADRYLLESGSPDGYLLEDGSGVLLLDALSPTTWNPADQDPNITLTGPANLRYDGAAVAGYHNVRGTTPRSSGKYYFEATKNANGCVVGVGNALAALNNYLGSDVHGIGYFDTGYVGYGGGNPQNPAAYPITSVEQIAVDIDTMTVTFGKDGSWNAPIVIGGGLVGPLFPMAGTDTGAAGAMTANFGATAFVYAPPTGYLPWDPTAVVSATYNETLTESITPDAATATAVTFPNAIAAALTSAVAQAAAFVAPATLTESFSAAAAQVPELVIPGSLVESLTPASTATTSAVWPAVLTESITAVESSATAAQFSSAISEAVSPAVDIQIAAVWQAALTEAIIAAESSTNAVVWAEVLQEALTATMAVLAAGSFENTLEEGLGLSCSFAAALIIAARLTESTVLEILEEGVLLGAWPLTTVLVSVKQQQHVISIRQGHKTPCVLRHYRPYLNLRLKQRNLYAVLPSHEINLRQQVVGVNL